MADARGHGLSDPPGENDGPDAMVKDLIGFVQAMKFERPILIGHSMGAATVMRVAAQYPEFARAVVMIDPGLGARPPMMRPPAPPSFNGAPPSRKPGQLVMFGSPETLVAQNNDSYDVWLDTCKRQNKLWDPLDCQYWALSKRQYHGTYRRSDGGPRPGGMRPGGELLAQITLPALILKADAPPEVREANLKAASVMKNGKLVHIDGGGHNLHHDKRAESVKVLREFLATVR